MITFLLGLPGSGKSYFAVDRIFNNFSTDEEANKDKKVTFKNCYTNINQFEFEKVENTSILDFEKLHEILTRLHGFTKGKNKKDDNYLLKFCTRCKIKDTFFVIDEAQNYFDKKDVVLVWWLSYHRHLHHEIILITQNLSLIEAKYKAFSEFFYVAKPESLRLFKKLYFKYNVYTNSRLSKASAVGDKKIKQNQKVFSLYKSGDSINTTNVVLKYLLISLFIFIVLITFFYFFVLKKDLPFSSEDKKEIIIKEIPKKSFLKPRLEADSSQAVDDYDYESRKFLTFSCSLNSCDNDLVSIPPQLLAKFIKIKQLNVLYKQTINKTLDIYYLDTNEYFYNYLIPQRRNDEDEKYDNKKPLTIGDIMPNSSQPSRK